ncbi:TPA: DUF3173 domain-containing protein [Streptococcus suis]
MAQLMVNKEDLKKLGFKEGTAISIICKAKLIMVQKGYTFYNNRRLGQVPATAVESILGISISEEMENK